MRPGISDKGGGKPRRASRTGFPNRTLIADRSLRTSRTLRAGFTNRTLIADRSLRTNRTLRARLASGADKSW